MLHLHISYSIAHCINIQLCLILVGYKLKNLTTDGAEGVYSSKQLLLLFNGFFDQFKALKQFPS